MTDRISLEKEAVAFSDANASHPCICELAPEGGRVLLEEVQESPVNKYPVDIEDLMVDTGEWGKFNIRLVRSEGNMDKLPVIFYIHEAGWVFGNAQTHDKLIREFAVRINSVVVFPEYSRSPEAKYPTAIEQNHAVLQQLNKLARSKNLDLKNLVVVGDSVGGNMATIMTTLAEERKGLPISKQLLYYSVTNANFDTGSYHEFGENYFLTREGIMWFWDQYTTNEEERAEITASPLRANINELNDLPSAMILTGEADVSRDEGEAYARKLRDAGVPVTQVRFQGIIHDFIMVNTMDQTKTTCAVMALLTS